LGRVGVPSHLVSHQLWVSDVSVAEVCSLPLESLILEVSYGVFAELRPVKETFVGSMVVASLGRTEQYCSLQAANSHMLVCVCDGRAWGNPTRVLTRSGSLYWSCEVNKL
jgi:hypothetical protein